MAPKAHLLSSCDLNTNLNGEHNQSISGKEILLERSSDQSLSNTLDSDNRISPLGRISFPKESISILLNALSSTIVDAASPGMVGVMLAMPIAVTYPILQFMMFLTIIIGTSPLYFILITLFKTNNKFSRPISTQQHRPSIVGSISPKVFAQ